MRGNVISNLIVGSGYLAAGEPSEKVDTELSQVSDMYDGRILIIDSRLKVVRDTYGLEEDGIVVLPGSDSMFPRGGDKDCKSAQR